MIFEQEKMSKMRQTIAKRLKGAQNTYAMLTTFQEVIIKFRLPIILLSKDEKIEKII